MLYSDITQKIIGAAMAVHSRLKRGYPEKYYQRAMAIELRLNNLNFVEECSSPVWYREYIIGDRRVDFLV